MLRMRKLTAGQFKKKTKFLQQEKKRNISSRKEDCVPESITQIGSQGLL